MIEFSKAMLKTVSSKITIELNLPFSGGPNINKNHNHHYSSTIHAMLLYLIAHTRLHCFSSPLTSCVVCVVCVWL